MLFAKAHDIAQKLQARLEPGCARVEIVGSVKRHDHEEVHDIEILCIASPGAVRPVFGQKLLFKNRLEEAIHTMQSDGVIGHPILNGDRLKKFPIHNTGELNPFFFELYIVRPETWAIQNVIRTGPKEFSQRFVTNTSQGGLLPDPYKYIRGKTEIWYETGVVELQEELDAILLLGLGWIEPKDRHKFCR